MRLTIKINPKTGQRTIEVEGVAGSTCTSITEALTRGKEVLDEAYTSEYYQDENVTVQE